MALTRRSLLYGTASVALAAIPLPALPAAPLSEPKAEASLLLESLLAASAIESWSRNRSAAWWKVDQLWEDIVQLQLAEHGYDYAMPRPGDPPNFPRFSRFMQIWDGLPLGKQVAVVLKAVSGRFETIREANQAAAYILVAFNHDAPGDWYEDKLQWALCALRAAKG